MLCFSRTVTSALFIWLLATAKTVLSVLPNDLELFSVLNYPGTCSLSNNPYQCRDGTIEALTCFDLDTVYNVIGLRFWLVNTTIEEDDRKLASTAMQNTIARKAETNDIPTQIILRVWNGNRTNGPIRRTTGNAFLYEQDITSSYRFGRNEVIFNRTVGVGATGFCAGIEVTGREIGFSVDEDGKSNSTFIRSPYCESCDKSATVYQFNNYTSLSFIEDEPYLNACIEPLLVKPSSAPSSTPSSSPSRSPVVAPDTKCGVLGFEIFCFNGCGILNFLFGGLFDLCN